MSPLQLVNLPALMELSSGSANIAIGLIDGPVALDHPDLAGQNIRRVSARFSKCTQNSAACIHGTAVAGILSAKRGSVAPAICPGCTLLVHPIFAEATADNEFMPNTAPEELADAITDSIKAGARVLNLSLALAQPSSSGQRALEGAFDHAARRGVIVVAAAGNQGTLGSTAITRHPWVIPVVAYDLKAKPLSQSNLAASIGRRGLGAPGDNIISLGVDGKPFMFAGTSAATPFVTGAIALLWSIFPKATAAEIKLVIAAPLRRTTVLPPLLNAWAAYQAMARARKEVRA